MKKVLKTVGIIISALILICIILFTIGKHSWRLFGFKLCENPDVLSIETIYVTDEGLSIVGTTLSSATSYVGYTYKLIDDSLYIGIKQNLLLGFTERLGSYGFEIECDLSNINAVYLTNGNENKCIWELDKDKKYMEKIRQVRLYESVSITDYTIIEEEIKTAEFTYAETDLLDRIRHPDYSRELYITKDGGYLGVAELYNGDVLYLEFDRHYDSYRVGRKFGYYTY